MTRTKAEDARYVEELADNGIDGRLKKGDVGGTVEIKRLKSSIFDFAKDPDIVAHRWGPEDPRKNGLPRYITYRARLVTEDQPSVLGWKIIRLAMMGKSWSYIHRVTGIDKQGVARLFRDNLIYRKAVMELEQDIIQDSRKLMVRQSRRVTAQLVKMALGKNNSDPKRQQNQLAAIREFYNRMGFGITEGSKGGRQQEVLPAGSDRFQITVAKGEADDLALLIQRRKETKEKQLAAGKSDLREVLEESHGDSGEEDQSYSEDEAAEDFEGEVISNASDERD